MLKKQTRHRLLSSVFELNTLTKHSADLKTLFQQAQQKLELQTIFEDCLPHFFKNTFAINKLSEGKLTITCHSAAIATRFRFEQDSVLANLKTKLGTQNIQTLDIRIRPKALTRQHSHSKAKLSKENAQLLLQEAGQTKDVELKRAMEKLAQRAD